MRVFIDILSDILCLGIKNKNTFYDRSHCNSTQAL
jgi:hypothetical protein